MITTNTIKSLVENRLYTSLTKRSRQREFYYPRLVYFKLCTHFTNNSLHRVGQSIFYDHATVINAVKQFDIHCGQGYFKRYEIVYNDLKNYIEENFITTKTEKKSELRCIEDVENMYRIKAIKTQEKFHKVISNMNVLKNSNVIQKISELPEHDISEFERLADVFYKRKRKELTKSA